MQREYKGVIWTNHALERLAERGISQGDAWATLKRPDQSRYASSKKAWIYYRTYGNQRIEVVASQNEKKQWVVVSVWSKEVFDKGVVGHKRDKPKSGSGSKLGGLKKFLGKLVGNTY